jgi:hypothetical protein
LAIVLIVPMCLLASVTGLLARGMPIDILAQIGFVVLVGTLRPLLRIFPSFYRFRHRRGAKRSGQKRTVLLSH